MKRLVITLAMLFALGGLAYAGGGDYDVKPQPQEQMWVQKKYKDYTNPKYKMTIQDYCAIAGVCISAIGVGGGLYINSRRKKQI